jgi:hypothetical protein
LGRVAKQFEPAAIVDGLRAESLAARQNAADRKPSAGEFFRDKAALGW